MKQSIRGKAWWLLAITLLSASGAAWACLPNNCRELYEQCLENNGPRCEVRYVQCLRSFGCPPL